MPHVAESQEASCRAMLKSGGGYTSSPGVLASYVKTKNVVLSPFEQHLPGCVESMVSEEVSSTVIHFAQNMLLTEAELGAVFQNTELPRCTWTRFSSMTPVRMASLSQVCFVVVWADLILRPLASVVFSWSLNSLRAAGPDCDW